MHARDFEDLNLQEQRAVEEHVVRLLRDAARATGQDIDPIVANVLLPESGWLQRELLELQPAKYPTRNPLIDVEFAVTWSCRCAPFARSSIACGCGPPPRVSNRRMSRQTISRADP